jgi:16S rRNA (cytosine1402-N4)-methyltransferase
MQQGIYHMPVMLQEVMEGLQIIPGGTYIDCTFGGGGHSKAILGRLNTKGKLFVFDQDEEAKQNIPDDERVTFIPHNFRHLRRFLRLYKITKVNGILADLGVSGHQIDKAERGFSTRHDATLDMRMDQRQTLTAADIITKYPAEKLHKMFEQYGEVTNSKTLAKTIVKVRNTIPLLTINEFKNAISPVIKGNPNKYLAQVFQALRIEVNDEFGALEEMLQQIPDLLLIGGRIAVITFHSLEDRMVKNFLRRGSFEENKTDGIYGTTVKSELLVLTKKPITPGEQELKNNPRSRSAKLRIAEKI